MIWTVSFALVKKMLKGSKPGRKLVPRQVTLDFVRIETCRSRIPSSHRNRPRQEHPEAQTSGARDPELKSLGKTASCLQVLELG